MAKSFTITIRSKGKNPVQFIKEVDHKIHYEFKRRLIELGEDTAKRMRDIISTSAKRKPTSGLLEKSINSEMISSPNGIMIGIGAIASLPPYWEVINNGGYVPPPNYGCFGENVNPPEKGKSGEHWYHTGDKSFYYINPIKAISPMRYVDIANAELTLHIQNEINRLMNQETQLSK